MCGAVWSGGLHTQPDNRYRFAVDRLEFDRDARACRSPSPSRSGPALCRVGSPDRCRCPSCGSAQRSSTASSTFCESGKVPVEASKLNKLADGRCFVSRGQRDFNIFRFKNFTKAHENTISGVAALFGSSGPATIRQMYTISLFRKQRTRRYSTIFLNRRLGPRFTGRHESVHDARDHQRPEHPECRRVKILKIDSIGMRWRV